MTAVELQYKVNANSYGIHKKLHKAACEAFRIGIERSNITDLIHISKGNRKVACSADLSMDRVCGSFFTRASKPDDWARFTFKKSSKRRVLR